MFQVPGVNQMAIFPHQTWILSPDVSEAMLTSGETGEFVGKKSSQEVKFKIIFSLRQIRERDTLFFFYKGNQQLDSTRKITTFEICETENNIFCANIVCKYYMSYNLPGEIFRMLSFFVL